MEQAPPVTPEVRLSAIGQTYVAMVAVLALISTVSDSHGWYVALVLAALPLSLLALWVGFYASMAVGAAVGHDPGHYPWSVAIVWVAVWATTAWVNARLGEKLVRRGWEALRVGGPSSYDDDDDDAEY